MNALDYTPQTFSRGYGLVRQPFINVRPYPFMYVVKYRQRNFFFTPRKTVVKTGFL